MARVQRVRNGGVVPPHKCARAIHKVIDAILDKPQSAYCDVDDMGDVRGLNEYHHRITWRLQEQGTRYCVAFADDLLLRLHNRIQQLERPWAIERELWVAIIKISSGPLPREIGLHLIQERVYFAMLALATSNQHPDVHWAAAEVNKQARNRFAHRIATEPQFTTADVAKFLNMYPGTYYLMHRAEASDSAKRELIERWRRSSDG